MTHIFASAAAGVLRRAGVSTRSGSPHSTGAAVLRGSLEEGSFEHRFWRTYQKGETDRLHQAAVDLARIRRHGLRADRRQSEAVDRGPALPSILPPRLSQSATAIFKLLCELGRLCKGEIYPTYDWFIEKTGFARATVARAIAQLKEAGFLIIQASPQGLCARQRFGGHNENTGYATSLRRAMGSLRVRNSPGESRFALCHR